METIIKHEVFKSADMVDKWLTANWKGVDSGAVKIIAISDNGNNDDREYTVFYADKRSYTILAK